MKLIENTTVTSEVTFLDSKIVSFRVVEQN